MKRRRSFSVVLFFLLALLCAGLWWFLRPTATAPAKTATALAPAKIDSVKIVAQPVRVELPKAPAVAASDEVVKLETPASVDPQANLKTALLDLARLIRTGDGLQIYQTYTNWGKIDPQRVEQIRALQLHDQANPKAITPLQDEAKAKFFEELAYETPTYNETGDEATYVAMLHTPSLRGLPGEEVIKTTEIFMKTNGKWYWRGESQAY